MLFLLPRVNEFLGKPNMSIWWSGLIMLTKWAVAPSVGWQANVECSQDYIQGVVHYYGERQAQDVYNLSAFLHAMHHQPLPPTYVPPYYPPYPGHLLVESDED